VDKEVRDEHLREIAELLSRAGIDDADPADFRRYGSARSLYHWNAEHHQQY
jgi:hypothetical protein